MVKLWVCPFIYAHVGREAVCHLRILHCGRPPGKTCSCLHKWKRTEEKGESPMGKLDLRWWYWTCDHSYAPPDILSVRKFKRNNKSCSGRFKLKYCMWTGFSLVLPFIYPVSKIKRNNNLGLLYTFGLIYYQFNWQFNLAVFSSGFPLRGILKQLLWIHSLHHHQQQQNSQINFFCHPPVNNSKINKWIGDTVYIFMWFFLYASALVFTLARHVLIVIIIKRRKNTIT